MSIRTLNLGEPFFTVKYLEDEPEYFVKEKSILINIAKQPISIQYQQLNFLSSVIVVDTPITNNHQALLIEGYDKHTDENALFDEVKKQWALAYDVRKEERLKGVSHYISPRESLGKIDLNMYHSGSVPLNVGLHKTHRGGVLLKEVHTQIVGFGKMQQCLAQDINTLYLEETMAPGMTHKPMYDEQGLYPWHQYETITPSIFMAIELLP